MTINKRVAVSALSIATAGALLVGATFAFFTDTSSSTGNQFRSGILDLQVRDGNEGFGNTVSSSFVTPAGWAPGQTYSSYICFKNNGNVDIQQILFDLDSADADSTELDNYIYVNTIELGPVSAGQCGSTGAFGEDGLTDFTGLFEDRFGDDTPLSTLLVDVDGTDPVNDDLLNDSANLLPPGAIVKLRIDWKFDESATNSVANQSLTVDLNFTATQNEVP